MRNIDKTIDEFDLSSDSIKRAEQLKYLASLITVRKTSAERMDLMLRCSYKFKIERKIIEDEVDREVHNLITKTKVHA